MKINLLAKSNLLAGIYPTETKVAMKHLSSCMPTILVYKEKNTASTVKEQAQLCSGAALLNPELDVVNLCWLQINQKTVNAMPKLNVPAGAKNLG